MTDCSSFSSHITEPSLFALSLPPNVEDYHVRQMFKAFSVTGITLTEGYQSLRSTKENWRRLRLLRDPGSRSAQIDFRNVAEAEKAFATLNRHMIPQVSPSAVLSLSTTPSPFPLTLKSFGNPRFVKLLPSNFTDVQLYDLIRPFGPLVSAHVDINLGGIVQFWTEDDAKAAEVAVRTAFSRSSKVTLQAYDPCNLFCTNLSRDVDATSLKEYFKECGSIVSARVIYKPNGQSRGYGFVAFSTPEEASSAMKRHDGAVWRTRAIVIRYHEPKPGAKAPPTEEHVESQATPLDPSSPTPSETTTCNDPDASNTPKDEAPAASKAEKDQSLLIETLLSQIAKEKDEHQLEIADMKHKVEKLERQRNNLEDMIITAEKRLQDRISSGEVETEGWIHRMEGLQARFTDLETQYKFDTDELNAQLVGAREENARLGGLLEQAELGRDDWRRKFDVADSRRKILELEADRPLWEEAKKVREQQMRAKAEEAERIRKMKEVEESQRRMRELRAQEEQRNLEEKRRKEREEAARKAREAKAREQREAERVKEEARQRAWKKATDAECGRCRGRDAGLCAGGWDDITAFARVLVLIDEFEKIKFSEAQPLTFRNIPWPILDDPSVSSFTCQGVTWEKVEKFFTYVARSRSVETYNRLVEKVHRMFHPDKWRSRRILDTVRDPELRNSLDVAGNVVAQAVTPIWRRTR